MIYKVVRNVDGFLRSWNLFNPASLVYEVGQITYPEFGLLFGLTSLKEAEGFLEDQSCEIYTAEAEVVPGYECLYTLGLQYPVVNPYTIEEVKNFWEDPQNLNNSLFKRVVSADSIEWCIRNRPYLDQVCCKSIKLLEKVNRGILL